VNLLKAQETVWMIVRFLQPPICQRQKRPNEQIPAQTAGSVNQSSVSFHLASCLNFNPISIQFLYFKGSQLKPVGCSVAPRPPRPCNLGALGVSNEG
jgi:hypothetical protein